jgi:hypothetical protein
MNNTERMLNERYHKLIPVEMVAFELLINERDSKRLLRLHPIVEVSDTAQRTFKFITIKTMLELLDVCR